MLDYMADTILLSEHLPLKLYADWVRATFPRNQPTINRDKSVKLVRKSSSWSEFAEELYWKLYTC